MRSRAGIGAGVSGVGVSGAAFLESTVHGPAGRTGRAAALFARYSLMSRRDLFNDIGAIVLIWCAPLAAGIAAASGAEGSFIVALAVVFAIATTWFVSTRIIRGRISRREELAGAVERLIALLPPEERPEGIAASQNVDHLIDQIDEAERDLAPRLRSLARDAANFRAALEAVESPVLLARANGQVIFENGGARRFFQHRTAAISGAHVEDLFTQAEVIALHRSAAAGRTDRVQIRITTGDGPRVYQVYGYPVPITYDGGQEAGAILTMRDITELAMAVQLKTDFVANASHEFRTPLSSIRAAVETIEDSAADDPAMIARLGGIIGGNVNRLEELVRDLLDLSRLESPEVQVQPETVRVSEIAAQLHELFQPVLKDRQLALEFDLAPALDRLYTDRKLFTLILKNLIDNATKYAYEGSTVRVVGSASSSPDAARRGAARIQVIDRGVGIPIGMQSRIFERFFQVDLSRSGQAQRRGTGLGLAIVKHAVKTLGGSIGVHSIWKEGTTMTIDLPNSVEAGTRENARSARQGSGA